MSVDSFYSAVGGDAASVRGRLMTDERIMKFMGMFLADPTYENLANSLQEGDMEAAFRASHTLKGLADNMGLTGLHKAAYDLTEALRPDDAGAPTDVSRVRDLLAQVQLEQERILAAAEAEL